jgi:hypothetical protein
MRAALVGVVALTMAFVHPAQSSFDAAVAAFERAWRGGDADAIAGMMVPEGIQLQLGSESHSLVAGRQARAAVAGFRGSRAPGRLDVQQAGEVAGDPPKGSAQFRWRTVVQGTSEEVAYTIFVELTRATGGWRISALRVF